MSQTPALRPTLPDHYATLGLDRCCTDVQIRTAYRLLAKQLHPDVNGGAAAALAQTQALNAAYEILSDPVSRSAYDDELAAQQKTSAPKRGAMLNISKELHLRIEEFLRGTRVELRMNEPGQGDTAETHELIIPPGTAPGARFRLPRPGGGFVTVKVKTRPDFRFRVRNSDLRCDLKINFQRARQGGIESVRGATGNFLRIQIPPQVARGEIIRLPGEGLPKARGGRGDLLVRVLYAPEIRIRRITRG